MLHLESSRIDASSSACEPFQIDDLLDLPNDIDEVASPSLEDYGSFTTAHNPYPCETLSPHGGNDRLCSRASLANEDVGHPSGGLCVPSDELADQLEWLSTFVEDSSYSADTMLVPIVSSGDSTNCNASHSDAYTTPNTFHSPSPKSVLEEGGAFSANPCCLSPSIVVARSRARSKRSRTGGRVWSLDTLIPTLVENRLGVEDNVFLDCNNCASGQESGPVKKAKRPNVGMDQFTRRCTHCLVQKTPQWRAGPMGPKTLCNACGVRYKSGRLVPEYRPAGSPSFVNDLHSNSHKRILEMRRLKEFEASEEDQDEEDDIHASSHEPEFCDNSNQEPDIHASSEAELRKRFHVRRFIHATDERTDASEVMPEAAQVQSLDGHSSIQSTDTNTIVMNHEEAAQMQLQDGHSSTQFADTKSILMNHEYEKVEVKEATEIDSLAVAKLEMHCP